tara:strand:- start:451 stop:690 length:240 start_codon:yes stop_codon:yes gene_type:complete
MIVFVIIILIVLLLKNIIKEGYNIWKSNPYIKYNKYKVKELVTKYGRNRGRNKNKKYTVVYMPQNDKTTYLKMSGSNTK